MRNRLISELRLKDLYADDVLDAMSCIPRHHFIDSSAFLEFAYQDTAFPIGAGQTISHPSTVAFQTTLLNIKKGDKVLEIGTGCGFQTAVLCELKAKVYSIERQRELYDKTKVFLEEKRYNARLFFGDGYKGNKTYAPYDRILVTCGAPKLPIELLSQLKNGGVLVIPVGAGKEQKMIKLTKDFEGNVSEKDYGIFKFVPMLERKVN